MASLISELVSILEKQSVHFEELLVLSTEKKNVIVNNDIEMLQKITAAENIIVSKNQKLEKQRLLVMKDIANVLNQDYDSLTISSLTDLIDGQPEQPILRELGSYIKETLEKLKVCNDYNKGLINSSLEYIDFSMNVIRSSISDTNNSYDDKREGDIKSFFDANR